LVLVVDDDPDVADLFRQQFRGICAPRFVLDFANSAADTLAQITATIEQSLIAILSDINLPGRTGLEMPPRVSEIRLRLTCCEWSTR
jgi:CheY-like chemotaxis protein